MLRPAPRCRSVVRLSGTSGSATIGTGATLELAAADSASVTFSSSTGMLKLDSPSTFSGLIFNFAGNGSLSGSDQIDLKGINFNSVHDTYANGVLTVTDGTHTAALDFNGSYTLANFKFASDGSGGTIVYDPPVPTGQSGNVPAEIMNDPAAAALDSNCAFFRNTWRRHFPLRRSVTAVLRSLAPLNWGVSAIATSPADCKSAACLNDGLMLHLCIVRLRRRPPCSERRIEHS